MGKGPEILLSLFGRGGRPLAKKLAKISYENYPSKVFIAARK
jgi:hypothetical protein